MLSFLTEEQRGHLTGNEGVNSGEMRGYVARVLKLENLRCL
jgi:hypothetical protein